MNCPRCASEHHDKPLHGVLCCQQCGTEYADQRWQAKVRDALRALTRTVCTNCGNDHGECEACYAERVLREALRIDGSES